MMTMISRRTVMRTAATLKLKDIQLLSTTSSVHYHEIQLRARIQPEPLLEKRRRKRRTGNTINYNGYGTTSGLYGLHGLHLPKDFERLAIDAIDKVNDIMDDIKSRKNSNNNNKNEEKAQESKYSAAKIVYQLDEISDTICAVVDVAELCRNTHPDREFVKAAEKTYLKLQNFVQTLNGNVTLYESLVAANVEKDESQTEELRRVAQTLRQDFERGGIHLSDEKRRKLEKYSDSALRHGFEFQQNLIDPRQIREVELKNRDEINSIPAWIRSQAKNKNSIPADQNTMNSILRTCDNREVRRQLFKAGNSSPDGNRLVLSNLLKSRNEAAEILGFSSHASLMTGSMLSKTPNGVKEFLLDLSSRIKNVAEREFKMLEKVQKQTGAGDVRGWDILYLMRQIRSSEDDYPDSNKVAEYFSLESVIKGMNDFFGKVLGVEIKTETLITGESWCGDDIKKLRVTVPGTNIEGVIYLDLVPRGGKFPHAAHFVIRCGHRQGNNGRRQTASVALVCNFAANSLSRREILLTHQELETFLHEFGHAMHSVLSDTEFQHLSGTRGAMDYVEVPSHVFEYFAWDANALQYLGRHYKTGEAMPTALLRKLKQSKRTFQAMDLQQQIVYALLDLELHSNEIDVENSLEISKLVSQIQSEHSFLPSEPGTSWELRFGHTVGYGSSYYSYLYAKCLSAEIWHKEFTNDKIQQGGCTILRDKMLKYGGSRDPAHVLTNVLGPNALETSFDGGIYPSSTHLLKELF
jgi:mitochondrial intermediate peptidase